ncbi:MAG: hypothetical protein QGH74_01635 [Candidatus Brocadiia bacterium]|nr:hypothetical protein [Candidatus Brocadiia bacterium]
MAWEIEQQQKVVSRYNEALADVSVTPAVRPGNVSVWAQYCIRVTDRDAVQARLHEAACQRPSSIPGRCTCRSGAAL